MSNYWNKMSPMNSLLSERVGKAKGGRIGLRDRVFRDGGKVNTSRENRLEELGRVDSEKKFAKSKRGKANLSDEKRRIVRELRRRG